MLREIERLRADEREDATTRLRATLGREPHADEVSALLVEEDRETFPELCARIASLEAILVARGRRDIVRDLRKRFGVGQ